jgi:hypothetical protein
VNALSDGLAKRWADLGLKRISDNACPRVLAGKRCLRYSEIGRCWCMMPANDHSGTYRAVENGRKVVVWEPYQVFDEDLFVMVNEALLLGLHITIDASSAWNPGRTISVHFMRQEDL